MRIFYIVLLLLMFLNNTLASDVICEAPTDPENAKNVYMFEILSIDNEKKTMNIDVLRIYKGNINEISKTTKLQIRNIEGIEIGQHWITYLEGYEHDYFNPFVCSSNAIIVDENQHRYFVNVTIPKWEETYKPIWIK